MLLEIMLTAENVASTASSVARVYSMSVNDEPYLLLACDFSSKLKLTYIYEASFKDRNSSFIPRKRL